MKLSEIRGEATFEVLAEIIDPIINIANDKSASALFNGSKPPKGVTPEDYAKAKIRKYVPKLLKGHKKDLITILAALSQKTPDEYSSELTLAKLTADVMELIADEGFTAFFS